MKQLVYKIQEHEIRIKIREGLAKVLGGINKSISLSINSNDVFNQDKIIEDDDIPEEFETDDDNL